MIEQGPRMEESIDLRDVTDSGLPEDLLNYWPLAVGGFMADTALKNPEMIRKQQPMLEQYIVDYFGSGAVDVFRASEKFNAESEAKYNHLATKYNSLLEQGLNDEELIPELKKISSEVSELFRGENEIT